jgi:hypothetical protein
VSPANVTFQYFYEGLVSPSVENLSPSTNLTNPQLTIRVANTTGSTAPDQFDLSLVTYNDTAKFNLARLDATGNSGVSGIRNVSVEGDILTKVTAAASSFTSDSSPAGIDLPQDNLASVGVRDYAPMDIINAKSIQAVAFGSTTRQNGQLETGAAVHANDAAALLTPSTTIVQAGSTNGRTVETFRAPFADLTTQQVGFFMDDNPGGHNFDNNSITLEVQGVSTANSSGTANAVTPSNVARGADIALITVAETFDQNNDLQGSVIESIALWGDGGSIQTQQTIGLGNGNNQTKVAFSPAITSTGPLGDVTIGGNLPSVTAPSIFGSLLPGGNIPATSIVQTTGIRTDPITGMTSQIPADLGRIYVTTTNNGPVLTTTLVQSNGGPGLAGQILTGGNLISTVVAAGGISGVITTLGNLGTEFTYPSPSTAFTLLGGVDSNGPMDGPVLSAGNNNATTIVSGDLQGGTVTTFGNVYGKITVGGPMAGPVVSAGDIQSGNINVDGVVQGGYIITHGSLVGDITIGGPMSGPAVSTGNNQYGNINVNDSMMGGFITTYGSVTGDINVNGPVSGPVVSGANNQDGTITVDAPVQGGSITTGGTVTGNITIGGPLNGPVVSGANNQDGTIKFFVPLQGGRVVTIGNMNGMVTIKGPVQGGVIATNGAINGNMTIGGPLSGQIVSVGNINGNVTISGGLQSGRIAALGSILGNLRISGTIDIQSALISGGSIGGPNGKLYVGNINGIVAAVGSISVGQIGSTNTALLYKQNDALDAAVIDSIFSQGVSPLGTDLFDQTTPLDLHNLSVILANLNSLSVKNGKLLL